ncbi:MAG: hemerythrin domain-containing protein [Myxococcota bacterium]|jgi:hemerythrin superfamily protein|nr:hemerythrin domain-containing protein [Myxococcota bacterium]
MKATELLKQQHGEVSRLFKAIEKTEDPAEKKSYFLELASNLVAHDGIERKIFYPACEEAMGMDDLLGEALVEHGVVEFSLYQASQALGKDDFDYKCKVLKELVEHHVEEEEKEFFPKVEKALGKDKLESLGEDLDEAFQEERENDYQEPLFENLRQVLAGVLKTVPEEETQPKAKVSGKSRRTA